MVLDLGYFCLIAGAIALILVLAYTAMRAVDHAFRAKETDREYAYETMIQNDAYVLERVNKRQELQLGYDYNRRLVQGFCDRQKAMSQDLIKQVNNSVWENAKRMMADM